MLRAGRRSVVTLLGLVFAVLLSGTVFVERIFSYTGLGLYAFTSATSLDLPAIMGIALVRRDIYIVLNFVVDVLYGLIDPRMRHVSAQALTAPDARRRPPLPATASLPGARSRRCASARSWRSAWRDRLVVWL